eukprot:g13363.t1
MFRHGEEEDVLRSFLEELMHAEPHLQAACLLDRYAPEATSKRQPPQTSRADECLDHHHHQLEDGATQQQLTARSLDPLRLKLRELSAVQQVSDERQPSPGTIRTAATVPGALAAGVSPGLVYSVMNGLVHFVTRLLPLVGPATETTGAARSAPALANGLVDLALVCLANLLESPSWRHVFFRVLHDIQREQHQQQHHLRAGNSGAKPSGAGVSLQEHLWRRIVADAGGPLTSDALRPGVQARAQAQVPLPSPASPERRTAVDHVAARLCCSMVRHCPLSFSASSYAALAPHLTDYLLSGGGSNTAAAAATTATTNNKEIAAQEDLTVLLDLFAACARGSPHFRQYVKGLRRKRELFRRLLGFLGPRCDGAVVVRALCVLTRILAGDPLEGKVFDRGNALETASLVMDNLLDIASSSEGGRGDAGAVTLGEQRRYADVASDLARSHVFMSVLLDTGRLEAFLREAVGVLCRAAADVLGRLSADGSTTERSPQQQGQRVARPEPLLRALCSFCLEHSPARSTFIKALLGKTAAEPTTAAAVRLNKENSENCSFGSSSPPMTTTEPCMALFLLCLHPHPPSAAAASTLLQCLLVGGGALGAVSGPSPGAAGGVGVIPAGFMLTQLAGGGAWGRGEGIGREDPLQAALLERIGALAFDSGRGGGSAATEGSGTLLPRLEQQPRASAVNTDGKMASFTGEEPRGIRDSGAPSSCSESDDNNDGEMWLEGGLSDGGSGAAYRGSASQSMWPGALKLLVLRLGQIGGDLASASAKQQLGLAEPGGAGAIGGKGRLKARAVELEQELTSVLCLLSSLVLAVPAVGRALGRVLPLEAAVAPILAAQKAVLAGTDPVDYPRAPVEIVLVALTLLAQLGMELSGSGGCTGGPEHRSNGSGGGDRGRDPDTSEAEKQEGRGRRARARQQRRGRKDLARAARLRRFLGEQAAAGEAKLCLGHAACRAESKDLSRRAAALISLLQAGGGADALLVADSLYAFAQSAEAREASLRSRAAAAENGWSRERAAGARRDAALEEAEGLVAQIEARNAEDLRMSVEQESAARRRMEEAHARALTRGEMSLRRAEETARDLERVLRSKEEAMRCSEREARAKDLEIAALKGDLAGEQRLKAAVTAKLEEAVSERDELSRGKAEAEAFLDATKAELSKVREDGLVSAKGWEDERERASRGWTAAREAGEGLERSNGRAEEAYGKLILLARGYKSLEEDSRRKATESARLLMEAETQTKLLQEKVREEERRHLLAKAAVRNGEASLQRAEQRLARVSGEAAEAQAAAAAAKAAGMELKEKVAAAAREAGLRRDEVARLKGELERSRAACAQKDLELSSKSRELAQQSGIIDYINKLSSNAAAKRARSDDGALTVADCTKVVKCLSKEKTRALLAGLMLALPAARAVILSSMDGLRHAQQYGLVPEVKERLLELAKECKEDLLSTYAFAVMVAILEIAYHDSHPEIQKGLSMYCGGFDSQIAAELESLAGAMSSQEKESITGRCRRRLGKPEGGARRERLWE